MQGGVETQIKGFSTPCLALPRVVPTKTTAPLSRYETHHKESLGFLRTTFWTKSGRGWRGAGRVEVAAYGLDTLWDAGKRTYVMFRVGTKSRKRKWFM